VDDADAEPDAVAVADAATELDELDELEQAASTGPATAARPPATRKRRRSKPALDGAEVFLIAIETEVPLSLLFDKHGALHRGARMSADAKESRFPACDAGMSQE
jgi:hypothetical protein